MWFRNLLAYRFTQDLDLASERLAAALAAKPAKPCASGELSSYGFVPPLGKGDMPLIHASQGFLLLAARKEERLLPAAVIKDALKEKIEEIETAQMRKVYRKEREQLQDDIVQTLLPRAFIRRSQTHAAIAPALGLLLVNSTSVSRAEELLSTLREALGSLPLRPVEVKIAPSACMTDWLKNQHAADGFTLQGDCELRDTHEDGGLVRCQRQDLAGDEIRLHLESGKIVTQLALDWQEKLSFVLDDKLAIKRLRFSDLLTEQAAEEGSDDGLAEQDASFTLMMLTLSEFLPALFAALGDEALPAQRS